MQFRFLPSSAVRKAAAGLVVTGVALLLPLQLHAASCCGGGSASSLILPKFFSHMYSAALNIETYDGFWNQNGVYLQDPPGSDLEQMRLNLGFAYRLTPNWQASVVMPLVWNDNRYSGLNSSSSGPGDISLSAWYETFDEIMCVYEVRGIEDLVPAVYFGGTLTLPTGKSAYGGDVTNSFDITGRGFYRLDASVLMDKTIWPWTMIVGYNYGVYLERPVNEEYGKYVQPYDKQLGDRQLSTLSIGYTDFLHKLDAITYTLAWSNLREDRGTINGLSDPTSGFSKQGYTFTAAYSSPNKDWIVKASYNHAVEGRNFPATDVISVELSHVIP